MYNTQEITEKNVWDKFVLDCSDANFLQSWVWGEFHQRLNHKIHRTGFYRGITLVGVMLSIVERSKRAIYLTVPAGPLIDWSDKELIRTFKETISKVARENACSFVRVRPQILETGNNADLFSELGFIHSPMHLHAELTHQLELNKSEDELLAQMRKATRYEIRQADKLGIKVIRSTDLKEIDEFYDLQMQTAARQGFVPFSKKYLKEQFHVLVENNMTVLYSAYLGKLKLAQAMIIFYDQEADYHYGASSEDGRKYPGAYLIQWEAIKEAKKRGMSRYNFWGVAPEGNTKHRFHGVSVFKRGFGGQDVSYLHARDLVISWPKYLINWAVETTRRVSRGL
jgi:lipid II:glycine glycyltransferase (peptidoglycan interpeptide bridge formation enzyme)